MLDLHLGDAQRCAMPERTNPSDRCGDGPGAPVRLTVTFPRDDYEEICRIAESKKVSASWVVRDAVDRYFSAQIPLLRRPSSESPQG